MSGIAIKVENLTKEYKLYDKPTDRLKEALNPFHKEYHKDFYALKNVSFEVMKGETVGIVGKNGSGKSTLLKVITGVLTPTSGNLEINGKISALLELGAGFNPEFTGLQNIYLNGTMMGYSKEEMEERVPSIIEFADIGDFIYQPVKTYSSGMFVRLAFAVAINVDPDILIVDEALSVGDDLFQRKCFAKFVDFKKQGKTILFVSHSGGTIIEFCDRAILLESGNRLLMGESSKVVNLYHKLLYAPVEKHDYIREQIKSQDNIENDEIIKTSVKKNDNANNVKQDIKYNGNNSEEDKNEDDEYFDPKLVPADTIDYERRGAQILNCEIVNLQGKRVNVLNSNKRYIWRYEVKFLKTFYDVRFGMLIKTISGLELGGAETDQWTKGIPVIKEGEKCNIEFEFSPKLAPGTYFLNCGVLCIENDTQIYVDRKIDIAAFRIKEKRGSLMTSLIDFDIQPTVFR